MSGKLRIAGGIVLAVVVALVLVQWMSRPSHGLPNAFDLVCVETGKAYRVSRNSLQGAAPWKNPDTGNKTLLPVITENGKQRIDDHYRPILEQMEDVNKTFDPATLARKP